MAKKKVQVILETVKQEDKTIWQKIKDFFYNSGTIMWNWLLGVVSLVGTTAVGIMGQVDWSQPMSILRSGTQLTANQWVLIGVGTLGAGIIGYSARVSGTKEVDGHLLPKAS